MRKWLAVGLIVLAGCADVDPAPITAEPAREWSPVAPAEQAPVLPMLENITSFTWAAPPGDVVLRLRMDLAGAGGCGFKVAGEGNATPGVNLVAFADNAPSSGQTASGLAPYVAALVVDSDDVTEDDTWGGALGFGLPSGRVDLAVLARQASQLDLTVECAEMFHLLDGHTGQTLGLWNARSITALASAGAPGAAVVVGGLERIELPGSYARFVVHSMELQLGQVTLEGPFGIDTWTMPAGRFRGYEGPGDYTFSILASGSAMGGWWAAGYTLNAPM